MDETAARKVAIRNLFRAYPSSANTDMATIDVYVAATANYSLQAIANSVEQFATGKVERDNRAFAPSADEFSQNVGKWQAALDYISLPSPTLHNGLLNVDFGMGRIDMRGLTAEEQDAVMSAKGITSDGKSMAYMSIEEIKGYVSGKGIEGPSSYVPKLARME